MISRTLKTLPAKTAAPLRAWAALACATAVLFLAGCSSFDFYFSRLYKRESRPGQTKLKQPVSVVPAKLVANYFIVEVKWDKRGPWRFIVDTGSSVTLLSPEFVRRYSVKNRDSDNARPINVRSASGQIQKLQPAHVRIIQLGDAQFFNVPVLVYDCADLSAHFGMQIDGILGFPLFRDTVFALDYPKSRLVISRRSPPDTPPEGSTILFNNETRAPIIPVNLDGETFSVLIDSGSDGALILNPVGLKPEFLQTPRTGAVVGTIMGDRVQEIGRLKSSLKIGAYTLEKPIADVTDQLSSLGGTVLKNFRLTFDPQHNSVTFHRDTGAPLVLAPQRSSGLAFTKMPAYWRVASVVPGSPAEAAGVQTGDLVARINGEPVSAFTLQRYDTLVRRAPEITFTFVQGARENPIVISTFDLVP